jgi:hypothetical protein
MDLKKILEKGEKNQRILVCRNRMAYCLRKDLYGNEYYLTDMCKRGEL